MVGIDPETVRRRLPDQDPPRERRASRPRRDQEDRSACRARGECGDPRDAPRPRPGDRGSGPAVPHRSHRCARQRAHRTHVPQRPRRGAVVHGAGAGAPPSRRGGHRGLNTPTSSLPSPQETGSAPPPSSLRIFRRRRSGSWRRSTRTSVEPSSLGRCFLDHDGRLGGVSPHRGGEHRVDLAGLDRAQCLCDRLVVLRHRKIARAQFGSELQCQTDLPGLDGLSGRSGADLAPGLDGRDLIADVIDLAAVDPDDPRPCPGAGSRRTGRPCTASTEGGVKSTPTKTASAARTTPTIPAVVF